MLESTKAVPLNIHTYADAAPHEDFSLDAQTPVQATLLTAPLAALNLDREDIAILTGVLRHHADALAPFKIYKLAMGRALSTFHKKYAKCGPGGTYGSICAALNFSAQRAQDWIKFAAAADAVGATTTRKISEEDLEVLDDPADGDPQADAIRAGIKRGAEEVSKAKPSRQKDVMMFKASGLKPDVIEKIKAFRGPDKLALEKAHAEYARQVSLHGPAAVLDALSQTFAYFGKAKAANNA